MMPQNRIEHFVAEFSRDVNFFFASSQGFYKSRILIMTYTTRSGQIQTQGSQGSETLQITACYRCFICLEHIDVLCSSYQFDESVDEEVCGSSLWCLYIAWMVM
ncbi:hypothetical protein CUMW_187120 [Citrus unshiu]|uniref:Uncharacterized protein n=1 Tax=Citrus unshiu TaxID=55188 RepID=A0A2H5Q1E3_CITUN|nr:hypothetical protein CUMW_187120 [Citrus unshiu]